MIDLFAIGHMRGGLNSGRQDVKAGVSVFIETLRYHQLFRVGKLGIFSGMYATELLWFASFLAMRLVFSFFSPSRRCLREVLVLVLQQYEDVHEHLCFKPKYAEKSTRGFCR